MATVVDSDSKQSLGTLKITHSLDIALRGLRENDVKRTLWIDAISINQDDLEERSEQVLRMGDIYRQASRVVVWLGPALEDTHLAMTALQLLGQHLELSDNGCWYRAPEFNDLELGLDQPIPFSEEQWDAIEDLLFMPWFRRLWVLQEITTSAPGSILQCGQHQTTYHDLRRALAGLTERSGVPNDLSYIINDKNDLVYGLNQTSMGDVLSTSRQHLCADPRDKVYGILGLLGTKIREGIQPSYHSSYQEVYRAVFELHSNNTARLDLLSQCCFAGCEVMPSWLPDWRAHPKLFRRPDLGWQASGMPKADYRVVPYGLECTSLVLDTVLEAHAPAEEGDRGSFLSTLKEIQPTDFNAKYLKTDETLIDAWAATLTVGAYQERTVSAGYEPFTTWKEKLLHVLSLDSKSAGLVGAVEGLGNSNIDNLECMRYFKTQQGYIGLGPVAMERSDRICVLLGAFTPLVIRAAGDSSYQLIGWCYVHGLMDSEALLGPLPEPWRVEEHFLGRRQFPKYRNARLRRSQREDPRLGRAE
ncbi:Putative heterokaryon incompatibility [Septoria linicola]|uniref:Heterokaryon incompatibility n=1 Tax=Septoria linicola TaxID=215465 RepID=A0A9Q9EID3_9PEZI|nr:Putative heterokaryon incompatibility [Septoria linicola]